MSDNRNNEPEKDINEQSIDEILKSFHMQKERNESNPDEITMPEAPVKSERQMIDFSAADENPEKARQKKDTAISVKKTASKINFRKLIKPLLILVAVAAVITGAVFGIKSAVSYSKTAYLKPYHQKYPDVKFPEGILEKYCDIYGESPEADGYIEISELDMKACVMPSRKRTFPSAEANTKNSKQKNYVVYLENNALEQFYKDADSYNQLASGIVSYTDFKTDYTFKIIGAFYTNTLPEDDNGYIFPYNVTEEMSEDSTKEYIDRLSTRFLYTTGITPTREDTFITLSCPTDYRENFRFVVVGVARQDDDKLSATPRSKIRYPQVIYDENGIANPFRYAGKWYPEIIVHSSSGEETTIKQSVKDYK